MNRSNSQSRTSTPSPPNLSSSNSNLNRSILTTTNSNSTNLTKTTTPLNSNKNNLATQLQNEDSLDSPSTLISSSPISFEFPLQSPSLVPLNSNSNKLGSGVLNPRKPKRSTTEPFNTTVGSSGNSNVASQLEAKVVILGSQGVGKTSIVHRYTSGNFSYSLSSTIGASFLTKKLVVDGCKVRLQIWDTAGQERFRSMAPLYYRGALAAILVYDITNQDSFKDIEVWLKELRRNMTPDLLIHIVGSKADLSTTLRKVNLRDARKSIVEWISTSETSTSKSSYSKLIPSTSTTSTTSPASSSTLSPPYKTESRESSPSPTKERMRTMSTRTTGGAGGGGGGGGSNPSLKTCTSSNSNPNNLPSSSTVINSNRSNSPTPPSISSPLSSPVIPTSNPNNGSRSRKSSTKNSSSLLLPLATSTNVSSSGSHSSSGMSNSTLIDLSLSATLNSTTGGNGKGTLSGKRNGAGGGGGGGGGGGKSGMSAEEERSLEESLESERIEGLLRDCGVEVSEVSAKDDFGIEDLFLLITSRLVERKAQIETNRVLRSRDSFMLADTENVSVPTPTSWCC